MSLARRAEPASGSYATDELILDVRRLRPVMKGMSTTARRRLIKNLRVAYPELIVVELKGQLWIEVRG